MSGFPADDACFDDEQGEPDQQPVPSEEPKENESDAKNGAREKRKKKSKDASDAAAEAFAALRTDLTAEKVVVALGETKELHAQLRGEIKDLNATVTEVLRLFTEDEARRAAREEAARRRDDARDARIKARLEQVSGELARVSNLLALSETPLASKPGFLPGVALGAALALVALVLLAFQMGLLA